MSTVDLLATSQEPIKPRSYFKQAVAIKPPKRAHTPKRFLSCLPYEKGYTALLGIGFFFLFCAFNAAQRSAHKSRNLQGTIGGEAGSWSLAVLYITNAFSNAFAPIFVKFIREKWCMVIGCSLYIFYLASNINPMPALLMTAAAFCGIGGGLLWNSQSSFVVHISSPGQVGRNSGLFFLFHQASSVVGNIIAATIILLGTLSTQMLFVVFTGISFLGLTTMLFVVTPPLSTQEEIEQAMKEKAKMNADKVEQDSEIAKKERRRKIIKRVFTSFILMSNKGALFLMVFWVQNGILQAFAFSTFTSVLGKSWIGWVMAAFGASDAIMSLVFGKIIKKTGCRNMMILSTAALAGVIIVLVTIPLETLHGFVASLFIIAAVLGLVDAGYTTLLFVSISNYFPSKVEAAFGAFRFCQALSVAMMFFIGPHTSYLVQSYIMAGATVCSFASIMVADLRYKSLDKEPIEEVEEVKTTIAMPTPILSKSAVPMTPVAAKKTIPDSPATWHPHRREEPIEASESSSLELVSVPFPASTPIVV